MLSVLQQIGLSAQLAAVQQTQVEKPASVLSQLGAHNLSKTQNIKAETVPSKVAMPTQDVKSVFDQIQAQRTTTPEVVQATVGSVQPQVESQVQQTQVETVQVSPPRSIFEQIQAQTSTPVENEMRVESEVTSTAQVSTQPNQGIPLFGGQLFVTPTNSN